MRVEYRDSVLETEPEVCPTSCIMRYRLDKHTWIDVTVAPGGIEIRSVNSGQVRMAVLPLSGNTINVVLQEDRVQR